MDRFDDIRPYKDDEIPEVMRRLARNDLLISTIKNIVWKGCPNRLVAPLRFAIRAALTLKFRNIKTVHEFQVKIIGDFLLRWVVSNSTDGLTCSGLESLPRDKGYTFISNHRDIVLDPALVNYLLHQNGHKVAYIAFGDNLLVSDFVSDLIRVNKAFIVKRDLPPREQLKALTHLSAYISHIQKEKLNFWIAQKEGRSKDGIDFTNPAIIKMFYLAERKEHPDFAAFIHTRHIVPVAISYEKDPCDRLKAWELFRKSRKGEHKKKRNEDLVSMAAGISGDKGRVHITFGEPLSGNYKNEKEVAGAIDNAIHKLYKLWPINFAAYDEVSQTEKYTHHYSAEEKESFISSYKNLKPEVREILLKTYANPVFSYETYLKRVGEKGA